MPPPLPRLSKSSGKLHPLSGGKDASASVIVSSASVPDALPDDSRLAAQIEQMADDVVTAEVEQMKLKTPSDMAGMVGKENLHRNGNPVYAPVRQFLMAELKRNKRFVDEVKRQGTFLERLYGHRPDAMRQVSSDASGHAANKVNLKLFESHNKPIFDIICGERFDYRDTGLSQGAKTLLEAIDSKLHAKLLQNERLSLREIERIRANLFKGILFTRGISPFLQASNDEDDAKAGKGVPEVNKNWSAAANRSFNFDYKEFAKSFVRHGNQNLPDEAKALYQARQDKLKAKRTQELTGTRRSKNPRARSQPLLPQGEDFQRAMRTEAQRSKAKASARRSVAPVESLLETINSYRALYAKNWTGTNQRRFKDFFDQRVDVWMGKNADSSDSDTLEKEIKAILKDFKAKLKASDFPERPSSSTSTTASERRAEPSSSNAPLSPRGKAREQYGIAETAKRQRQREEEFGKSVNSFLERSDCAGDFADDDFRADFLDAAWKAFDSDLSARDVPATLRRIFEKRLVAHFKRNMIPSAQSGSSAGNHPRLKQLEASVDAWKKARGDDDRVLSSEALHAMWARIERDAVTLATFKTTVSEKDKTAIARFASLDAAVERWRTMPANAQRPLTEAILQKLWSEASPQKGTVPAEPGSVTPQSPLSDEAARKTAQDRARERMRKQLAKFIEDPKNPDFAKRSFERAFLDGAIELQHKGGMAALQPEKLKRLYTETQIQRYWASRKEAGWPDSVRDALARLVHARCEKLGNHVATEEHFEEYRRLAMDNALGAMLQAFLEGRSSWQAMEPNAQFSFRKLMSDLLRTWIANGAIGNVEDQFKSTYQDKLLEAFQQTMRAEGKGQKLTLLRSYMEEWRKQQRDEVLEWDALERIYQSLLDTGFLDELAQHLQ